MTNETPAPESDDVEGHSVHGGHTLADDDVEGHRVHGGVTDTNENDVEGHMRARGASDSLDDPFGPLKR